MTSETHNCQSCKKDFTIESEDFQFYEKIGVPPPTLCWQCRYQRRIANRNEWNFYKRNCDLCGNSMVSIYNPSYPGPVYCQECWWSDKWDPLDYAQEIDFSRPFFDQFYEFRYKVPRIALANSKSINSEYTNQSEENKNCYMVVATGTSENCMYGNWNQGGKDCVDSMIVKNCELAYECIDCLRCYRSAFLETCADMTDSWFCSDCKGSSHCFGCVNLHNKSYRWFNEQLSKEEYDKKLNEIKWTPSLIAEYQRKFKEIKNKFPTKYFHGVQIQDCSGDYIGFSKNIHNAFNSFHSENLNYGQDAWEARDCMDMTETLDNELDYEMEGAGWGSNCIGMAKSWYNQDSFYSELNFTCKSIFGCVALRNRSCCIFNKQYSPEEYKILEAKLIKHMKESGEWGEFFPMKISPFPYNDSLAQDYFPLDKEKVLNKGLKWYDRDMREYAITTKHSDLPDSIAEVKDDILDQVISCSTQDLEEEKKKYPRCATAFRLHPMELDFYRRFNLPVPHKCFPCRLRDRFARRNPRELVQRSCQCKGVISENEVYKNTNDHAHGQDPCPNRFETSYLPYRKEIVYCESCYNSEID